LEVVKPTTHETTALGVAMLAGLTVGVWNSAEELTKMQEIDCYYQPKMDEPTREEKLRKWHKAVERSLGWDLT
jgi:glycerol kinase